MSFLTFKFAILLIAVTSSHQVTAHSWIEQMAVISSNGSFTGPMGYSRNYVARTDPGFTSGDYLLPQASVGRSRIAESDLLCAPSQRTQTQSAKWPRLQVAPGSAIAIKYLENGHVSLPLNNPGKGKNSGTVFVFGTTSPAADEKLADVLSWTHDGSGGDKRGYLLAANDFDDLRCYQINGGTISTQRQAEFPDSLPGQPASRLEQWCETNVIFPTDASIMAPGKLLTIYWVWDWATAAGSPGLPAGKDEYYTTCADLEVVASLPDSAPLSNLLGQQDPQTKAVSDYMSRSAVAPVPRTLTATSGATSATSTTSATSATSGKPVPLAGAGSDFTVTSTPISAASTSTSSTPSIVPSSSAIPVVTSSTATAPAMALSTIIGLGPRPAISVYNGGNPGQGIPISLNSTSSTSASPSSTSLLIIIPVPSSSSSASASPMSYYLNQPGPSSSTSLSSFSFTSSSSEVVQTSTPTPTPTPVVVTLTAVITVLATLSPGETAVVSGEHVITFSAPVAVSSAAVSFRA